MFIKPETENTANEPQGGVLLYTHKTHSFSKCSSLHTRQTQLLLSQFLISNWSCTTDNSQISNINSVARKGCKNNVHSLPWEIANRRILFELAEKNLVIISPTSFGLLHQHPWASQVPEVTQLQDVLQVFPQSCRPSPPLLCCEAPLAP